MKRARVLLADDHAIVTEGLRLILEPDFEVVGAVTDGRALVEAAANLQPDVIVVDVSMPLLNGIEAVRQIRRHNSKARVIFLSMHTDVTYATEALAAGGSAYVLKASAATELVTAIRQALKGGVFITPSIAERVAQLTAAGPLRPAAQPKLTTREMEVLQLVAEGRALKEIARILDLSPRTVEFHKYRMTSKLGLKTTAELTQYAIKHGIVSG